MSSYKVSHAELSDKRVYPIGPDVSQLRNHEGHSNYETRVKDTLINNT